MKDNVLENCKRGLTTAVGFLTRLPTPALKDYSDRDAGRSIVWFPVVGLLIGSVLSLIASLLSAIFGGLPVAGIILLAWILITGGLHLDGLADCADAWMSGKDPKQSLNILKDVHAGSGAVIAIVALLIVKFSVLSQLPANQLTLALCLTPFFARAAVLLLLLTTPTIREDGLARHFLVHANRRAIGLSFAASLFFLMFFISIEQLFITLLITGICGYLLRRMMLNRLGGMTGDTCGAFIEIIEVAVLLAFNV